MKTLRCHAYGPPESLVLEELPSPEPGKGQVRIRVKACGVNFPDTLIIQGLYQFKPDLPFSPGSEIAGIVDAVGEEVRQHKTGDEVFSLLGWGGFAEEVVADANVVFPKPPGMDFATAASFLMVYGTSYHALKDRARLQKDETLLVLGAAGGVGLAAVELGKLMGARVIAAASTAEKLDLCRQYGADATINYREEDLKERVKAFTEGKGADVIYDPVGGDYSETALRAINWEGRYLVVGFAAGDIPRIPLNLPLLKGCQIVGVFWGNFARREIARNLANTMQLIQWFSKGKLKPHIEATYSLAEAPEALRAIMDRQAKGKLVIEMKEKA